jgi:predicted RNase H-like nuclease
MPPPTRVLGVDACRQGWVGVVLDGAPPGRFASAHLAGHIAELVAAAETDGPVAVVGVDIPIGLPDSGRRRADVLAAARIGGLRSAVFLTPVRAALEAPDHARAVELNRALGGWGVSIQAFGLRTKVLQVDAWARTCGRRVVEVHPEVSFATLAGGPLRHRKATFTGIRVRQRLLESVGLAVPEDPGWAGQAGVDDVLDAAIAAWSAMRVAAGSASCVPDPPEVFADGWPAAIWA